MRYDIDKPHPEEWVDLRTNGTILGLPSTAMGRVLGLLLTLVLFAGVVVAIMFAVNAATARPIACDNLTADECVARAQEGW